MGGDKRRARAQGEDLGGTTIRARFEKREERLASGKERLRQRGAEPSTDERITSGSKVAHVGMYGAPTIYAELQDGRKGRKGKRG